MSCNLPLSSLICYVSRVIILSLWFVNFDLCVTGAFETHIVPQMILVVRLTRYYDRWCVLSKRRDLWGHTPVFTHAATNVVIDYSRFIANTNWTRLYIFFLSQNINYVQIHWLLWYNHDVLYKIETTALKIQVDITIILSGCFPNHT